MNLKTWYRGVSIPRFYNKPDMDRFVKSMMATFSITSKHVLDVTPQFIMTDEVETAGIDLKDMKVYISNKITSEHAANRPNPHASEDEALTTIFGMVFHESMHFVYTDRDVETSLKATGVANIGLLKVIHNILEDYYIDEQFITTLPRFEWTYLARYKYFFPVSKGNEMITAYNTEPSADAIMRVLISMKNPLLRKKIATLNPDLKKFVDFALQVISLDEQQERMDHSVALYKMLVTDEEINEEQAKELGQAAGADILTAAQSDALEEIEGNYEVDGDCTLSNGTYDESIFEITPKATDIFCATKPRMGLSGVPLEFKIDAKYAAFANLLKARSEDSRMWTPASHKGRQLRHISRVATDNKLFSNRVVEAGIGPQEIIILVDASASMHTEDNFWKAVMAAYASAVSLESGRHNVAVYAHTADHSATSGIASVTIYKLKGFNERCSNVKERFLHFYNNGWHYMHNNDDELAIEYVGKKFTKMINSKTLIVISDGSPSCHRSPSLLSTKRVVDLLRNTGKKVVSISIDEDAVSANNYIYGDGNNFSNTDPNVVTDVIRAIAHF